MRRADGKRQLGPWVGPISRFFHRIWAIPESRTLADSKTNGAKKAGLSGGKYVQTLSSLNCLPWPGHIRGDHVD
jgi:hypothetical protein